jgi:hypothetical protein
MSAADLAALRERLYPRLMHWLGKHLRRLPRVHLQLTPAEIGLPLDEE